MGSVTLQSFDEATHICCASPEIVIAAIRIVCKSSQIVSVAFPIGGGPQQMCFGVNGCRKTINVPVCRAFRRLNRLNQPVSDGRLRSGSFTMKKDDTAAPLRFTSADLDAFPDDGKRYEII